VHLSPCRYWQEQKDQAVRSVRKVGAETGQSFGALERVAEQLGYGVESLRSWVKRADIDDGATDGTKTAEMVRVKLRSAL
jgi:transposase